MEGACVASAYYEIRLAGTLPPDALPGLMWLITGGEAADTCVFGPLPDQSALSALLARLEELGVQVTEIRRLPSGEPPREQP